MSAHGISAFPGNCNFGFDKASKRFTCRSHGTTLGGMFDANDLPGQCEKARWHKARGKSWPGVIDSHREVDYP